MKLSDANTNDNMNKEEVVQKKNKKNQTKKKRK